MNNKTVYSELLELAEQLRFDDIVTNERFLVTFSTMSNVETYYAEYAKRIESLSYDILENLIVSLSDCGNKYYRGYYEDQYFTNNFYMIFSAIQKRRLTKNEQKKLINLLLENRQNQMMPFGVIIPLEIKNIKDLKKWQDKINNRINLY